MPDDDWALSQGTVDFRSEERRARMFACHYDDVDESAGLADLEENPRYGPGNPDWEHDRHRELNEPIAFCTCDAECHADADQHLENCPVEHQLREEMGF